MIAPARFFQKEFELLIAPVQEFRYILLGFSVLNICICVILEDCIVEIFLQKGVQRVRFGTSKLPYMSVLELIRNQPSWPPLSSTKLTEGKRQGDDGNIETREAILQLENVEILDENYVYNKYFGSIGGDANRAFPTTFIESSVDCPTDGDIQLSKLHHHEQAAQVLNKSYRSPERAKIIDDTGNGVASLTHHQHESQQNQTKVLPLYEEENAVLNEDSYNSGMVDIVKEYSR